MALADLQAFIVQCLNNVDPTIDTTAGSPYDVNVTQPLLRRLGTDPFTVDIGLYIQTLLNQNFPDMPTKEGDAITDLLIKAAIVLWNPIVREITRVKTVQSFRDPTVLTTDEAEALGANLFATRAAGDYATGICRIYFAQPQNCSVSPANYVTSQEGLHFFPTEVQSISVNEMLLNVEGSLYFFDVNLIAEAAGDSYNIGPDDLVTIANVASATRITNKVRFRKGTPDETAVAFVDRIAQDLTERSLVTDAGISAKITADFPEVTRLNATGFNDPEMQRDLLTGGGLGPLLAAGVAAYTIPDNEHAPLTRRLTTAETVDFAALIGPLNTPITGFVLTLAHAFPALSGPLVRDLTVRQVIDAHTLDLEEQELSETATSIVWMLRANTLTLSGIPGGILYPDTPTGTVTVPNGQVHIGGATDVFVRGSAFDAATLLLESVIDDQPALSGLQLQLSTYGLVNLARLNDLVLGTDYFLNDATYNLLANAATDNLTLNVLDPPNAGLYRIVAVTQVSGYSPIFTITPPFNSSGGPFRWRLSSSIFIDLVEPKDTKIAGSDLRTVQGLSTVDTLSAVDFGDYGVGQGDTLRITSGTLVVGDYRVTAPPLPPFYTKLQLDRVLPATVTGASYSVFTPNQAGGISRPFVRVDSIDLLDTSRQPVGTTIPYAKPIDIESEGFVNSAHGIKADFDDGVLGICTRAFPAGVNVDGLTLHIKWQLPTPVDFTVTFATLGTITMSQVAGQINTASPVPGLAVLLSNDTRVGVVPFGENVTLVAASSTSLALLFGYNTVNQDITSRDIRSGEYATSSQMGALGWPSPLSTVFDVAQVVDGLQVGFYSDLVNPWSTVYASYYSPLRTSTDFAPEAGRHIQIGSRSLGTARLYFLDPTSFEVDSAAVFTATATNGATLRYFPDPTNEYQRIPAPPSTVEPSDGQTGAPYSSYYFHSTSTDFVAEGIRVGDRLQVNYVPLLGSIALLDPVAGLHGQSIILSLGDGADKSITFTRDSGSIPVGAVTRAGVVSQINSIAGQVICSLDVSNRLQFKADTQIIVRGSSAGTSANIQLGFPLVDGTDVTNNSLSKGSYKVTALAPDGDPSLLQVTPILPNTETNIQFSVFREGVQRIISTSMANNVETASLYYFDVSLLSEGTGDSYNIPARTQMSATGYRSDGYYLTTDDPNLTFSPIERPKLHLSMSILEVGVSDDPGNATQLTGQNLQVNYDQSVLAGNVDSYIRSDTERVINQSPLGRHLIPYFVRFTMTYAGGSAPSVLIPDIQTYITGLYPTDVLAASNLEKLANLRGARSVDTPIDLIAVIHNFDRTVTAERSQNSINTGTLAAFIPDVLDITRRIA